MGRRRKAVPKRVHPADQPAEEVVVAKAPRLEATLTVPMSLLECTVCMEVPRTDIVHCCNGHLLCSTCYDQLRPRRFGGLLKCPVGRCAYIKDSLRSRLAEQIVDTSGLRFLCLNSANGCTVEDTKFDINRHEKHECRYMAIECLSKRRACGSLPMSEMSDHFKTAHANLLSPSRGPLFTTTIGWRQERSLDTRMMSTTVDGHALPFFTFGKVAKDHALLAVKTDLRNPAYDGLQIRITVSMPGMGSLQYTGEMYGLEDGDMMMIVRQYGLPIPLEVLGAQDVSGVTVEYELVKKQV